MRWFKHMTSSWEDQKLSAAIDELGLEGYGFWWRMLEIIAKQLDEGGGTSCSYSSRKWGEFFGISAKKFEKFAGIFKKFEIFQVNFSEKYIEVNIPNLLKYKDEWTRKKAKNSGVTPEKLRRKDTDTDINNIKEKIKKEKPASADAAPPPPKIPEEREEPEEPASGKKKRKKAEPPPDVPHYRAKSGRFLTGKRLESFSRFWGAFDFARGKAEAADAWLDIPELTEALVARICEAARAEASARAALEAKGMTPKWAQGWLASRRWEDYEPPPKTAGRPEKYGYERQLTPEERARAEATRQRLEAERIRKLNTCLGMDMGQVMGGKA